VSTRARLARELAAQGLLPSRETYITCQREVEARGEALLDRLASVTGRRTWRRGLAKIGDANLPLDCRRVAGFGELLTRFLIAPVPLDDLSRDEVARLGALANVIVALFDLVVDSGTDRRAILPRPLFALLASRRAGWLGTIISSAGGARVRLIARLVRDYFKTLRSLAGHRSDAVLQDVLRAIVRMYELEGRGRNETPASRSTVLRKSAFPLVVMGLPAWLAVPHHGRAAMRAHRRWLFKTARFIRWVDDAADEALDARDQHPNLFLACRRDAVPAVAKRAGLLITDWHRHAGRESCDGFTSCVVSWFGGPDILEETRAQIHDAG